ncbi:MAG: DUF4339 domain-containing protein [Bacteroides sp.]|nr:DUF4339 domain-containing protein [Bacteroides sp.]MBD5377678.1 DUF4339 domain-containing protein [Bacteroides sp.]
MLYYILYNGTEVGPMTAQQIMAYNVTQDTPVRTSMSSQWTPLYAWPELMQMLGNRPGAAPVKDKNLAGILALLVGGLGVQYFYLDRVGAGLVTILLTTVTCGFWQTLMFVQGIIMLCMNQEEFERKFVNSPKFLPIF